MSPGTIIANRYRIDREIGKGSFGVVYLAHDSVENAPRAIKVLLPWAAQNPQLRHRLRREARLAGSMKCPHAVKIYEDGETDEGDVFLAMEYFEGQDLGQLLQNSRTLQPERVQLIAEQVLAALEEAHRLGVIHRDLKPSNIFLCNSEDGLDHVKVFDFGIAKITGEGGIRATANLTMVGGVMGTPLYMSPEQCCGAALTPAADFYSLGIVLYELLTGSVPFDDVNPVQIMIKHNNDPAPPLPEPIASTSLGIAVMRSLAKDPAQRFASAADFLRAIHGEAVPLPSSAPRPAASQAALPEFDPDIEMPPRGDFAWGWWLMVLIVIAAGMAAFFLWPLLR